MLLEFNDDRTEGYISQPGAVEELLRRHNYWDSRPAHTPSQSKPGYVCSDLDSPPPGPEGDEDRAYMRDKPFREVTGDLMWIARVHRHDILHAVNACSRVANNPGKAHWHALCRIMRYLNYTRNYKLVYKRATAPHVHSYSDSDWAPNYGTYFDNYRSTSGAMHFVDGNPILWKSRRQDRVALSSCEAEFYSGASASKDTVYIDRLTKSLRPDCDLNTDMPVLFMDNKSAIQSALNAQDNEKQRHIDLRSHYLRDTCTREEISIQFVPGSMNPADAQTKALGNTKFHQFRKQGNLRNMPVTTVKPKHVTFDLDRNIRR